MSERNGSDSPASASGRDVPRVGGLFIAGAGPAPGKTLVAGAVADCLRRRGRRVEVFKPVATGCPRGRGGLVSVEADFLAACAESQRTLAEIVPVRYAEPLAPLAAARRAGRGEDVEAAILDAWARLAATAPAAVVEGPGGLLCPITAALRTADFARLLGMPVVLVARAGPAALDDVLLAHHAARSARLEPAGIVLNRFRRDAAADPPADAHMEALPALLTELTGLEVLALVPEDPANSVADGRLAPSARFAVGQVRWERLLPRRNS